MIIKEALKLGFYKENGVWYKPRAFTLNGKIYHSKQRMTLIVCAVCQKESVAINKKIKTCSKSCFFKQFKGEKNHRWKGGGLTGDGYRWIYAFDSPMADCRGRVRQHRYVMSQILNRPLLRTEQVHHINGIKIDNRPENLLLVSLSEHMSLHESERIKNRPRDEVTGRFLKSNH